MTEEMAMNERRIPAGPLVFGMALVALGGASFLDSIDLFEIGRYWRFWPMILILIGIATETEALQQRRSGGGYVLIAVGVWMLASQGLFGLTYRTAFPLALVVVGAGLTVHALTDLPGRKEKGDES